MLFRSIEEIVLPMSMAGKNLIEINLRAKYNITVIGIKTDTKVDISPDPEKTLRAEDILIVLGENSDLDRFTKVK